MDLEQFIEQAAKPGPEGVVGRVLEKRFARELKTYFKKLGSDILAMKLEDLAGAGTTEAIARHQVAMRIQRANRVNQPVLLGILRHHIEAGHLAGQKQDVVQEAEFQEWPDADGNDDHGREGGGGWKVVGDKGDPSYSTKEVFGHDKVSLPEKVSNAWADKKLGKGAVKTVSLADVHPTESLVHTQDVEHFKAKGSSEMPEAVMHNGKTVLLDGHHRVAGAIARGDKTMTMRVFSSSSIKEADDQKKPADKLGQTGQDAADYAAESAGELITGLEQTTIDDIADAVATGIEDRLGVPETAGLIKDIVDGMSTLRAETIAATEMADAFGEAMLEKIGDLGFEYKRLVLSEDACPICEENADADPLPVDDDYPSGDQRPPFHPNCRCAIVAARGPDESDS